MAKRRKSGGGGYGIRFQSFAKLAEEYDRAGADIKEGVDQILADTHQLLTPEIKKEINKYPRVKADEHGRHIADYVMNTKKVKWEGNLASINIGFLMQGQGKASIYLMYNTRIRGTPRVRPADKKLYQAAKGMGPWRKRIHDQQKKGFIEAMERQLGGKK